MKTHSVLIYLGLKSLRHDIKVTDLNLPTAQLLVKDLIYIDYPIRAVETFGISNEQYKSLLVSLVFDYTIMAIDEYKKLLSVYYLELRLKTIFEQHVVISLGEQRSV
jgi:hypothetical protein